MNAELDLATATFLCRLLVGYGIIVWALEYLAIGEHLGRNRALSWDVGQLRYLWSSRGRLERPVAIVFGGRGASVMLWSRLAFGVLLLLPGMSPGFYSMGMAGAAILSIAWYVRAPPGQDGSDQLFLLLTVSLALAFALDSPVSYWLCALFVSAQLTICYLTAGIAKLRSKEWRSGEAILLVFRTYTYGSKIVHRAALGHRLVPVALAWAVMGLEILFPVVFILPRPWGEIALAVPLLFHLATALFMGLNLFLVSFLAAYPFLIALLQQQPLRQLGAWLGP